MDLQEWMRLERYTDQGFINLVNDIVSKSVPHKHTASWRTVLKWRIGESIPRPHFVEAIEVVTKGAVKYEDHRAKNAAFHAAKRADRP